MSEQESPQEEHKLIAERRQKLDALRESGNAFPNDFRRDALAQKLQQDFVTKTKAELEELDHTVSVAGRIMRNRGAFLVLQDCSGQIQLYVNRKALPQDTLAQIKSWDLGDIVGARGPVHKSGKGDLYIDMQEARLLTKSLRPLPDKYHGLADRELRYRQRYVDLIMNPESRRVFELRAQAVEAIRQFMLGREFVEVETPMMQPIPGGAAARPFVTHHNALEQDMYLRIAPELYLKRLVVGGLERVFEINRNFRNEGLSTRHNPEFTMLEFYQAYADYHDLMDLTEAMLRSVAQQVLGSSTVTYQGESYDLSQPFKRLSIRESLLQFNDAFSGAQLDDRDQAAALAATLDIPVSSSYGLGKIQLELFEKTVEHKLQQPVFITGYPAEVSPLARRNDKDPFITDRFELFICGREIANGFSELNDAQDQAERFRQQAREKEAGDDEAMHYDADYVTALEYGMPPTAGEGIGIDRLVMFLTDTTSIRDVLLFPHLRPQENLR